MAARRRPLDDYLADGRAASSSAVRRAVHPAGHRRSARRTRGGPRRVRASACDRGAAAASAAPETIDGAQPAGVSVRAVRRLHRGSPPRAARRTCSPGWPRDIPRRLDARGHRRRAGGDQRLLRRAGDDGPAARAPRSGARRASPNSSSGCAETRPGPELHRGDAADREPGQGRLPAVARCRPPSAASTSRPAPR